MATMNYTDDQLVITACYGTITIKGDITGLLAKSDERLRPFDIVWAAKHEPGYTVNWEGKHGRG